MTRPTLLILTALIVQFAQAQVKIKAEQPLNFSTSKSAEVQHDKLIVVKASDDYKLANADQVFAEVFDLPAGSSFRLENEKRDKMGYVHQKFQQYHQGIKVLYGTTKLHALNGEIKKISHEVYKIPLDLALSPGISKNTAQAKALEHAGPNTELYRGPSDGSEQGELLLIPIFQDKGYQMHLAYRFDLHRSDPVAGGDFYVDAHSGEVIYFSTKLYHGEERNQPTVLATVETEAAYCARLALIENDEDFFVPGTGETRYSGTRPIEVLWNGSAYVLHDTGRDVYTYNANNGSPQSSGAVYPSASDFTDSNTTWTQAEHGNDDVALDAHWGMAETYDYWITEHGRDSYDGAGSNLNSYVHVQTNYNNAFWYRSTMSYGDGDGSLFNPLTSLDVCAHEMGHGVTENSADLAYQRESGALNEGYSDIWGATVEHYSKGTGTNSAPDANTWLIGEEIMANGDPSLRSMSNPNAQGQPDTYGGTNWINPNCGTPTQFNDYCGVHTNSGVLNYWFYLLTAGGSGTNDIGNAFSVSGVGLADAEDIAWRTLDVYSSANTNFADTRTFSITAAEDLFGACSTQVEAVTDAWHAVGVGAAFVNTCVPSIGFASISTTTNEGSGCTYTDIDVTVEIAIAASANADVTFAVSGGSATEGVDFDMQTAAVTFPSGSTADQTMTIRIYHDDFVESDETVNIDLSVAANGGDAVPDAAADSFTLNIGNDDNAHSPSANVNIYLEDFDDGSYDVTTGGNAGSDFWSAGNNAALTSSFWTTTGNATTFAFTNDDNCNCDKSNDQLITTPFSLDGSYTSASLSFDHAFSDVGAETANVFIDHDNDNNFDLLQNITNTSTNNGGGNYTTPWVNNIVIDLSTYIGQPNVRILFLYNDGGNWAYGMAVDNISIDAVTNTSIQTAVNSGGPDSMDIHSAGSAHASDPSSGDVMADLTNNDSFDYGCVDVSVSRSGTSAQAYNGSSLPYHVMDKTFSVAPTNTTGSGDTSVSFYFEEAEIAGWEAATGLSRNDLYIARGNAVSIDQMVAASISAFGSDVILSANMSGLDGTYFFGHMSSFVPPCAGATKTWDGTDWSPLGAPDTTNPVIINGDYDTATHGSFDACTLTINATRTLTIHAGDHAYVQGSIVVDGTLVVEHQGSVVQVDDDAVVTNGGTINVNTTSPNLASRDFMILGSPMSGETRTDVWNSAFLVLNHLTGNFVPNPDVEALMPGAENFADDNYDNWVIYNGGINPGEGYIVRPQAGYGQPGGIFNYTYDTGTLNNGVVSFDVLYNQPTTGLDPAADKNASPNVVSNPYPSAIDANAFIAANDMVDEIFFWEHITPPSPGIPGAGSMNFSMEDISMRNGTGGIAATNDLVTVDGPTYNRYISTSQGFGFKANLAEVISNGGTINDDVVFNNAMRVNGNNDNLREPENKDRVWIAIGSPEFNIKRTTLVGFLEEATPGMDNGYDSRRMATMLSIYSHLQDGSGQLGIQAREAFDSRMKVELGFSSLIDTNTQYKISIDYIEGPNLENATVYLRDALNPAYGLHNLSEAPYTFTSEATTDHNRFTLLFEGEEELGVGDVLANSIGLFPNPSAGQLTINSPLAAMQAITIYDLHGRMVYRKEVELQPSVGLDLKALQPAMYFVNIQTEDGLVTKKLIRR